MKKIIFILAITLGVMACSPNEEFNPSDKLPQEIKALKELNKQDTLMAIQSENNYYFFDTKNTFIGSVSKRDYSEIIAWVFAFIGFFIGLMIGGIAS